MSTSVGFWNKRAKHYDRKLYKGPNYAARLERAAAVFPQDADVLDVGCATGEITIDLAQYCGQILGIDYADGMAQAGNMKAKDRGVENCKFRGVDAFDSSLAPGSFDAVTNYSLLHLVDDVQATVRRFYELLKPGGHLITEVPCLGDWFPLWRVIAKGATTVGLAPKVTCLTVRQCETMIRDAGFEVIESRVYNPKSGMHCILAKKS